MMNNLKKNCTNLGSRGRRRWRPPITTIPTTTPTTTTTTLFLLKVVKRNDSNDDISSVHFIECYKPLEREGGTERDRER